MVVNICTDGNMIRITDSAEGYKVSAINQKSFADMAVRRTDLNKAIYSIIDGLERDSKRKDGKHMENTYKGEVAGNTRAVETFAVKTEHGTIKSIGNGAVIQPRVKFSGKPMKWFDDSKLLKKNNQD